MEWHDAKALSGWTYDPKMKRTPGRINSLGIVVQSNEECLTISTSMDYRGASLDDFSIPVGCIQSITVLTQKDLRGPEEKCKKSTGTKASPSESLKS